MTATNKQTIWVKNEETLLNLLNAIWKQWGGDISFHVEQDGNGYTIHFPTN
jgi:hypothetical protein